MEYGAIDLHTKHSQIRIVTADGAVVVERRFVTRADQFAAVFGGRARMRVLLESSTESEWVATCLEALGHEAVVADPNFAAMYGTRTRSAWMKLSDSFAMWLLLVVSLRTQSLAV